MKLTIKQQLDTHDKLIANLLHGVFELSKVRSISEDRYEILQMEIGKLMKKMYLIRINQDNLLKHNKDLARKVIFWKIVVVSYGLSLLAILYLLWIKLP